MAKQLTAGLFALMMGSSLWAAAAVAAPEEAPTPPAAPANCACPQMQGGGFHHGMMAKKGGDGPRAHRAWGGMGHDMMGFMSLRGVQLTEQQQQQIGALKKQHFQDMMQAHKQNMEAMNSLMAAKNFDEKKAKQLIAEREQQRAAYRLDKLKMQHEIYQLLTDEQKQQVQQGFHRKRGPQLPQQQ
ncbi:Spy/CpxP family protein refolding chaperone [Shewanella sp.]|uniref:Spy/CpxP family protein refolding chaperone n=1 Tax=Shewanella sp. TaxID=50422 RepID=UPI003A98528D